MPLGVERSQVHLAWKGLCAVGVQGSLVPLGVERSLCLSEHGFLSKKYNGVKAIEVPLHCACIIGTSNNSINLCTMCSCNAYKSIYNDMINRNMEEL